MTPRLALTPYRLPLRRPWRSAHGLRREREGWLVQAHWQGCCGYGDCAPLPEAGTETSIVAAKRLSTWLRDHNQSTVKTQLAVLERQIPSPTPAADAALETALLDLSARLCGLTLYAYLMSLQRVESARDREPVLDQHAARDVELKPASAREPDLKSDRDREQAWKPELDIEVNAALGAVADLQPAQIDQALAAGFRVLKVKVGVALIDRELEAIQNLCARLPADVRLRLDANRAWTLATTGKLIDALRPIADQIECLEEPCAAATDTQLRTLQAQAPFTLALDESLPARGWPLDPEQLPLRRLVLKPGVIGGLRPTLSLAWQAQAAGLEVVITSLIESAAGLWSSAQLAAATGSRLAHGLATADWLATDLGPAPAIKAGRLQLPTCPGSGFVYADASAKRGSVLDLVRFSNP
ncbi:enolase C-terminal domain-like protein [Lamprobacter modestohalophilus]|uniref:mandelate racemase/muconate lactonizing enzyme family protein n=1 Tax=Lamprobacter modestohalophilus TaxID=1064514 RepID=UPI002ADED9D4|nr:enolase C-terminal domain-like protein [Lamprobacter modestohalophilus]MEA1049276.1 enolase C-terminal domain-like protein [Lamprobacter modestohalophilus]